MAAPPAPRDGPGAGERGASARRRQPPPPSPRPPAATPAAPRPHAQVPSGARPVVATPLGRRPDNAQVRVSWVPKAAPAGPARKRSRKEPSPASRAARKEATWRFALLAIVLVAATLVSPLLGRHAGGHAFVVASESMGDAVPMGAFVLSREVDPAALEAGDIIVYDAVTGVREVHRIIAVTRLPDGSTGYQTQGDANPAADSYVVRPDDVVGRVTATVPYLGYLWLVPTLWQAILFGAMVVAYVAITLWDARKGLGRLHGAGLVLGVLLVLLVPGVGAAILNSTPPSAQTADVATPPLPFSSGTWGTTTTANGGNTASVSLTAPRLWKEVQLWGCAAGLAIPASCAFTPTALAYSTSASTSSPPTRALADTAALDGTVQYYLEATLTAGAANTVSVQLYDIDSAALVSGSEVSTSSTTATTVRSGAFTLSGAHEVQWQSKVASLLTVSSVHSVKLLSEQQFPTKTQTSVPVAGGGQVTGTTLTVPFSAAKWLHETASLDGTVTAHFEAVASASALSTTTVQLVDRTAGAAVAGSAVTTTSTTGARVRSAAVTLVDGHEYEVEIKSSGALSTASLHMARVLLTQDAFTKTLRYEDLTQAHSTASTSFTTVGAGGRHNAATEWGSLSATFEATLRNSAAGTTSLQLLDTTGNAAVAGSTLTLASSTAARQRASVTLLNNDPGTYAAQLKASAATAEVRTAWLILAQADGKAYDHATKASNDVAGPCTWSFTAALTGSTGLSKLTVAEVQLTGDSGTVDQVIVAGGSATQTSGSAVSTAYGNAVKVVVQSRPNAAGAIQLDLDLRGTCEGIHTVQPFSLVLQ